LKATLLALMRTSRVLDRDGLSGVGHDQQMRAQVA